MVAPVAAPRGQPTQGLTLVRTVSTPRYLEERQSGSEASTVRERRERESGGRAAAADKPCRHARSTRRRLICMTSPPVVR